MRIELAHPAAPEQQPGAALPEKRDTSGRENACLALLTNIQ